MEELVSVIIPAFNAARFLERTIISAQNQTHRNLEIIVVEDGSTDGTQHVAAAMANSDARIKVIEKSNGGVASARNVGLAQARGEYVAFLDADDLWHPSKIELQIASLGPRDSSNKYVASFVHRRSIDLQDDVIKNGLFWNIPEFQLPLHIVMAPVGNGSSILVSRSVAISIGGFETAYRDLGLEGCEDFDFELKIAARFPIKVVPEYLVGYRAYAGNMSSNLARMARGMITVVERHLSANPNLSRRCARWARSNAYEFAMRNYFSANLLAQGVICAFAVLMYDPFALMTNFGYRLPVGLLKQVRRKLAGLATGEDDRTGGFQFAEFDPKSRGKTGGGRLRSYRFRALIKEGATYLSNAREPQTSRGQ